VLLVVVAVKLGLDSKDLLIGRAASPEMERLIRSEIESAPGVDSLLELQTMHMAGEDRAAGLGPDRAAVGCRGAGGHRP
jgi:divalent metal cation (Fe/Co/Zn/Cd) transporter